MKATIYISDDCPACSRVKRYLNHICGNIESFPARDINGRNYSS